MTTNDRFARALELINKDLAYTVYIDDTGTQNLSPKNTTRYVGVIVNPKFSKNLPRAINSALKSLNPTVNATEFHFSDIYQGQGEFRGVDWEIRRRILLTFVKLVSQIIKPAIFVQSMDPETAKILYKNADIPYNLTPKELAKFHALSGLLARINEYLIDAVEPDNRAVVFCDHGLFKPGIGIVLPIKLEAVFENSIFFIDSKDHPGIQLADFVAFVINRHQLVFQKYQTEVLNDKDITFMLDTQPIIPFLQNITKKEMRADLDPNLHLPYIIKQEIEELRNRITIISDVRTGVVTIAHPKNK